MPDRPVTITVNDDLVPLEDREFHYIATLLYDKYGIHLGDQKRVLVAGRLSKRLRQLGFTSFTTYIDYLAADKTGEELTELINRITTNHSFFFREREHFDFLTRQVFPAMENTSVLRAAASLRIWSAGCATGEEVYSLAMLLREHYGPRIDTMDYGLLATDISLAALKEAGNGAYAEGKLHELPAAYRANYFRHVDNDLYQVNDTLKKMVMFKRLNLMSDSFPLKGLFDVVFCRNVMIYFDPDSRNRLVNTMFRYIKPGGYFFIGHSESLRRETCPFEYIQPAVYRKGVR